MFIVPLPRFVQTGSVSIYLLNSVGTLALGYLVAFGLHWATRPIRPLAWRSMMERALIHIPVLGSARSELALARLAGSLEALLSAGILVTEAWPMAARASGSQILDRASRNEFKRHPEDPDTDRLNIETSRSYRFDNPGTQLTHQAIQLVTYHSILYTINGDVQNSSGGTVTINLHRYDNGELVHQTSRTGDGSFSITWHDDTIECYIVAIDADTSTTIHSDLFFAGLSATLLDFAGGGGGGPTYYAYAG